MNVSVEVMVLQPTSMPSIIILGGGAAKIDHIKEWNNDLYKLLFCLFCQKKPALKTMFTKNWIAFKVFRYSFSQTIPMFSTALKLILSLSDFHKISKVVRMFFLVHTSKASTV